MSTLEFPAIATKVREITFSQAIREALAEEMRRDPTVFIIGEDVAEAGTPFKVLLGLVDEFGTQRVIDAPISEPGFCGMGVGAAMTGMRPVVDIMFGDFLGLVMDQIANQAAKITTCQVASSSSRSYFVPAWVPPGALALNIAKVCKPGPAISLA